MPVNKFNTLVLHDGKVFSSGRNEFGQLGTGDVKESTILQLVRMQTRVICVACGFNAHSIAVSEDGALWGWGANTWGQLGLGEGINHSRIPCQVPDSFEFRSVAAGRFFSLALDKNGDVWCYGLNQSSELGLGDQENRWLPTRNPHLPRSQAVSAGLDFTVVLDDYGTLWKFGRKPVIPSEDSEESIDNSVPQQISGVDEIVQFDCGNGHVIAIDKNQDAWAFGDNDRGQLGLGDRQPRYQPTKIATLTDSVKVWCGGDYSFIKDSSDIIRVFGSNEHSQLGLDERHRVDQIYPVINPSLTGSEIFPGASHALCKYPDGSISAFGLNDSGQLAIEKYNLSGTSLSRVERINKSLSHTKSAKKVHQLEEPNDTDNETDVVSDTPENPIPTTTRELTDSSETEVFIPASFAISFQLLSVIIVY